MNNNIELESHGNTIEGALCAYDVENGNSLKDSDAIRIIETLIDRYYFGDQQVDEDSHIIADGVSYVGKAIEKDLHEISKERIVKVLGVIRFVARRRTKTGREYMNIIHQYVGQRVDTGIRLLRD